MIQIKTENNFIEVNRLLKNFILTFTNDLSIFLKLSKRS